MLQIGPYSFANPWILAPMAGVSEMPFRTIARAHGAAAAPTELVSAKGLIHGQERTKRYLAHDAACEQPFWVQIFGGDVPSMVEGAVCAVGLGAKIIDINMGCPVRKVTKNGAGSALLGDPMRAMAMVQAIKQETGVPVTVKIRAGWDADSLNFIDMAQAVAAGGCSAIALHARTRAQGYSGKAQWQWVKALVEASPIPVIGNGDIFDAATARARLAQSGCQAVMIGRGALGNPWMFAELTQALNAPISPHKRLAVVLAHLEAHLNFVGDEWRGIRRFRPHLMWYARGLSGAAAFRAHANTLEAADAVVALCHSFFARADPSPVLRAIDGHGPAAADTDVSAHPSEPIDFDVKAALG